MYKTSKSAILATLVGASFIGAGSSLGAAYSSKGAVHTTHHHHQAGGLIDPGLPMIAAGVQEFGLNGRLNWQDETIYNLNVSYGRFVTNNWLLGVDLGIDGVNSRAGYAIGVFAEYNFLTGTKWVPFIGLGVGYNHLRGTGTQVIGGVATTIDSSSDSLRARGEFGIKYFMRSNMALTASMSGFWDTDSLPDRSDFGSQINLGLRYFF